jgi:afadin
MLSLPTYALYEVHVNGEERKLQPSEKPLNVQLNWGKDDREGRFLLKREDMKSALLPGMQTNLQDQEVPPPMKRKLSKREKKELKKKEKEAKLKGKENEAPDNVATKLYNDLPDTSFTRTISNPEVVMRRRRQQKLEKKLQDIRSKDDQGGTLKIYGESIHPDVPYKTLLLSAQDPAWFVVKETLDKYGMEKENPDNFCLVQVMIPPEGSDYQNSSIVLDDDDCPLDILMHHMPQSGTIMFQLRRRTPDMPPAKSRKKKKERDPQGYDQTGYAPDRLPFIVEINPDGSEPHKALRHPIPPNVTEIGSEKNIPSGSQFIRLPGPDIQPRHCIITHYEGVVTLTPSNPGCATFVNNHPIMETTMLQHGMVVRFGRMHMFRFHNPVPMEQGRGPKPQNIPEPMQQRPMHEDPSNFETTFDTDGNIRHDLNTSQQGMPKGIPPQHQQRKPDPQFDQQPDDLLPASLEFREDAEDPFLNSIIRDVNGATVQFKLAPTYTLYMATRYRLSMHYRPDMPPNERMHRAVGFVNKTAQLTQMTVQDNADNAGGLSFWMANASELLNFFKVDQDISQFSQDARDVLAESVQESFSRLVSCLQEELRNVMPGMLNAARDDLEDSEVLHVLSSAMSLLRKCRVNAALTIQIFSQLFHMAHCALASGASGSSGALPRWRFGQKNKDWNWLLTVI